MKLPPLFIPESDDLRRALEKHDRQVRRANRCYVGFCLFLGVVISFVSGYF